MENAAGSTPENMASPWVPAMPAAHTFIAPNAKPVPASAVNSWIRPVLINRPLPAAPPAAGDARSATVRRSGRPPCP
ncbi:hypothetical protein GCM10020254_84950 [Streptomyces goshikiensis]